MKLTDNSFKLTGAYNMQLIPNTFPKVVIDKVQIGILIGSYKDKIGDRYYVRSLYKRFSISFFNWGFAFTSDYVKYAHDWRKL